MAQTAGFRNRLSLEGDAEVRRGFAAVGAAGEKAFGGIRTAVADSSRGFVAFRSNLSALPGSLSAVVAASTSVKTALAGIFAFQGVQAAVNQFRSVTDGMRELRNTAVGTGFATDSVKAFQEAVAQTGIVGERVGPALVQFAGTLGEARKGSQDLRNALVPTVNVLKGTEGSANVAAAGITTFRGAMSDAAGAGSSLVTVLRGGIAGAASEAATPFQILGVNVAAFSRDAAGMDQVLEDVARGFVRLRQTDPAAAVRAASLLFGEDDITKFGAALEQIARVGLPEFKRQARDLGRIPTAEQDRALQDYDIAWGNLRATVEATLRPAITSLLPSLKTLIDGAAASVESIRTAFAGAGVGQALSQWAESIRQDVEPALRDVATLITNTFKPLNEQQPLRTDFARGLVDVFASARDVVRGVIGAFRTLIAVIDTLLAPVNQLFGTRLRGDALLVVATLLKIVGGFAAITAVIALARTALLAFTVLAARTPFGLLAAGVALFVAKMTEGTETAQKFWSSINGDSSEAAKALGDTAANAVSFGNAAAEAERQVAGALGTTDRLGQAAEQAGGKFVNMANALPQIVGGMPAALRGVQQIGGAAEQVRGKFVDVRTEVAGFRKEVEKAAEAATTVRAVQPAPVTSIAAAPVPETDNAFDFAPRADFGPPEHQIGAWQAFRRELGRAVQGVRDEINRIREEARQAPADIAADVEGQRIPLPKWLDDWRKAFDDFFANIGQNAVDQAKLDTAVPEAPSFLGSWTSSVARWGAELGRTVGETFRQIPVGSEPEFLGSWGLAVNKFGADSMQKIGDSFSQVQVPSEPGFLSQWSTSLGQWLSGQVNEIKAAFSKISIPSLVSSAQAAPAGVPVGTGTGATQLQAGGALGSLGEITTTIQEIDNAKAKLTDFSVSIPTVTAEALNRVSELVSQAFEQFSEAVKERVAALNEFAATALQTLTDLINTTVATLSAGLATAFDTLRGSVGTVFDWVQGQITLISDSLTALIDQLSAIAALVGGAASSAAGALPAFAGGGRVWGPGTSTSDDVIIRASRGEAITKTRAVNYYGWPLFDMLNRMKIPRDLLAKVLDGLRGFSVGGLVGDLSVPIVSRSIPRFAEGGFVAAAAAAAPGASARNPVIIQLPGGQSFGPLWGEDDVVDHLERNLRKRHSLKA